MSGGRRSALYVGAVVIVWYAFTVGLWAVRPVDDTVPVGIDYAVTPPKAVSVTVKCSNLFDSAARDTSPLPSLKPQPKDSPPLAFQRTPCSLPHRQARLVFALDTLGFIAALGVGIWLLKPRRSRVLAKESSLVGSTA